MSQNSGLVERFARLGPVRVENPVRSSSDRRLPQHFVRTGAFTQRLPVLHRLRAAGLSLKAAHTAITELAELDHTVCDLPEDVDLESLASDLGALDVGLRRRVALPEPAVFLAQVRERHHLSQRQFADRLGFDVRTLQNWEQGRNRPDPAILNLVRIFDRDPRIVEDAIFEPL